MIAVEPTDKPRPAPPKGQQVEEGICFSAPVLKTIIRELKQKDPDISKEELQALCLHLGRQLLSRERAVDSLNNTIKNLKKDIGNRTRKKRG